jgi:hypothetical protein
LADRLSVALLDLVGFGFPSARTVVLAIAHPLEMMHQLVQKHLIIMFQRQVIPPIHDAPSIMGVDCEVPLQLPARASWAREFGKTWYFATPLGAHAFRQETCMSRVAASGGSNRDYAEAVGGALGAIAFGWGAGCGLGFGVATG